MKLLKRTEVIEKVNLIEKLRNKNNEKWKPLVSNSWDHWCRDARVGPAMDNEGNPITEKNFRSNMYHYLYPADIIEKLVDARRKAGRA